jgi:hypothetical protein
MESSRRRRALLNRMCKFVGQKMAACGTVWLILPKTKDKVIGVRKGAGIHGSSQLVRMSITVYSHPSEVAPHSTFEE